MGFLGVRSFAIIRRLSPSLNRAMWVRARVSELDGQKSPMADRFNRLPAVALRQAGVGMHADGGGLYLQVTSKEARSWIFRYTLRGVSREMGLGSAFTFGLSDARERARECRQLCADGIDPIAARDARMALQLAEAAKGETFARCASAYIEAHQAGW